MFVMLNPSTADATVDDPTIRRCVGFAKRWGFNRLVVGNVYGLRSTDPKALKVEGAEPVGEPLPESHAHTYSNMNDEWLRKLLLGPEPPERVICAWGTHAAPKRAAQVFDVLSAHHFPIECLGTTKHGHPKHPLYLPGDTEPEHFDPQ